MLLRFALSLMLIVPGGLATAEMAPREGWTVQATQKSYAELSDATRAAIKANGLVVVTQAGPTKAAKQRGIDIPGNLVIGAFNNDFAVRVLALSTPAMIEAPVRFYVTENADGTATLSYKTPGHVFAPYEPEAGPELAKLAAELDVLFAAIADQASQ